VTINRQNEGTGVLFKNNNRKDDRSPDYVGSITAAGVEYRLSAWLKTSKSGTRFMSLAIREPSTTTSKSAETQKAAAHDSDVPF
jgi:uncharacterized protein (DUF736 family)